MAYSRGEVTGLVAATLAFATIGVTMNFADTSPHLGEAGAVPVGMTPPTGSPAAAAGADFARPGATLPTPEESAPVVHEDAAADARVNVSGAAMAGADFARPQASGVPAAPAAPATPAAPELQIRRVLPISGPIRYGEWHWDETGVPDGALVITVDLEARTLSVFRDGYEIGATAVLLGTQEKPTPLGVFPITEKDRNHVSNLYDAPMPFMMRLTNDGVTIHATNVRNGYASHGCIGVPYEFAKKLFGKAEVGDRVYITRGKRVGLGDRIAAR